MSRLGTYTHEASIEVDLDDVMEEISDEELAEELDRRKKANPSPPPVIQFDVLFDVATAFHDTHAVPGVPMRVCYNILCRDATRALAAGPKRGE